MDKEYELAWRTYLALQILLHILESSEAEDNSFYFNIRHIIDPILFFQCMKREKIFRSEYGKPENEDFDIDYFFNFKMKDNDPVIIEIGFMFYFLVILMWEKAPEDDDEAYKEALFKYIPEKSQYS